MFIFRSQYYKIIAYLFDITILFISVYEDEIKINEKLLFSLQIIIKVSAILYQEFLIWYKIKPEVYEKHLPNYFSYRLIHPIYHFCLDCRRLFNCEDDKIDLGEVNFILRFFMKMTLGFYIAILYIFISIGLYVGLDNYKDIELDILIVVIFLSGYYYDVLSEYISLYELDEAKSQIPIDIELR